MLKISGESLAGDNEQGFDFGILNDLSQNIKILADKDISISIVLGGGNFIRGSSFSNGVVDRSNFRLYGNVRNCNEFISPSIKFRKDRRPLQSYDSD